jgi:hypothetical protein
MYLFFYYERVDLRINYFFLFIIDLCEVSQRHNRFSKRSLVNLITWLGHEGFQKGTGLLEVVV